jgi:hypothetical protein
MQMNLPGVFEGRPSCASPGDGNRQIICAVTWTDSTLRGIRFDPAQPSNNTGYVNLPGLFEGSLSCATANDNTNQVICVGRGQNSVLYATEFDPGRKELPGLTGLTPPKNSNVNFADDPSCANANSAQGVICAAVGTDGGLYSWGVDPASGSPAAAVQLVANSVGTFKDSPACASPMDGSQQIWCMVKPVNQLASQGPDVFAAQP